MPRRARVLAMIMAGGKGERLHPLTRDRSKPAVPFGGRHRIVDFVLSNFINSSVLSLYVLVQYKSQSLIEHVRLAWRTTGLLSDAFVTVAARQVPIGSASEFGVVAVDANARIVRFDEKPPNPTPIPGNPGRALASMGNYLFKRQPLV